MIFVVRRLQELTREKDTPCTCDLSTPPKNMTPSAKLLCGGMSLLGLECYQECSPSSANSTTAYKHACGWMLESTLRRSTWGKVTGEDACSRHCYSTFFIAVLRVAEKRFFADAAITDNMVQLQQKNEKDEKKDTSRTGKIDGRQGKEEPEEVQRLWSLLCADDADTAWRLSEGLERLRTGDRDCVLIVQAYGLRRENRDHMPANQRRGEGVVHNPNAAGRVEKQTIEVVYLSGTITAARKLSIEITRRVRRAWGCFQRYNMEIYDRLGVCLRLKVRLLIAEVIETRL